MLRSVCGSSLVSCPIISNILVTPQHCSVLLKKLGVVFCQNSQTIRSLLHYFLWKFHVQEKAYLCYISWKFIKNKMPVALYSVIICALSRLIRNYLRYYSQISHQLTQEMASALLSRCNSTVVVKCRMMLCSRVALMAGTFIECGRA